jgi:hypothetical protein
MDSLIATKVFDKTCEICKQMSRHDRATFEGFPGVVYQEVDLDDIINNQGNLTKIRLYQLLERHCLSSTYEIDLPVYLVMDKQGKYVSHVQGANTISELKNWFDSFNPLNNRGS